MGEWILTRSRQASLVWLIYPILAAAASFRFFNLGWDGGHLFHPDERHILMVTAKLSFPLPPDLPALLHPSSPLNPGSFAYGSFPFYCLAFLSWLLNTFTPDFLGGDSLRVLGHFDLLVLVGRPVSAAFDSGTVLLTFWLGRRLYGTRVGLLGAAFVAFATLHVQLSHFYASDTLLTFFIVLILVRSCHLLDGGSQRTSILAGAAVGAALACKVSAAPIVLSVVVAHFLGLADQDLSFRNVTASSLSRLIRWLTMAGVAALFVFVILEPYALIDWSTFTRHVSEQNDMVRGVADLPYTRQYANRPAYWYFVENLSMFGLGPALGVAVWGSLLAWLWRSCRRPSKGDLLLLAWVLPYFLITGAFHAKFLRYLLPLTPVLCLIAARELLALQGAAREWSDRLVEIGRRWARLPHYVVSVSIGLVLALTFAYALAYLSIYTRPHTAVSASAWIYDHVPPHSRLATEHWEEGLPVQVKDAAGRPLNAEVFQYQRNEIRAYEPDNQAKLAHLVEQLRNSDYILLFSNRLYGTIPRLPQRYPITTRYYQLLFEEKLGYELAAAFTSYPSLIGVALEDDTLSDPGLAAPALLQQLEAAQPSINLGRADESFTVYDHPKVLIFRKVQDIPAAELENMLRPTAGTIGAVEPGASPTAGPGLLLSQAQRQSVGRGGTFSSLFNREGWENQLPTLVWVLMVLSVGLAAVPIGVLAFGHLADRGYLLSRILGVLLLGWINWMGANLGLVPNDRVGALASFLLLLLIGLGLGLAHRGQLSDFWRRRRQLILTSEALFWGAFLLFLFIRMANPDLWHPARGGEKPMDLAYLMAAIKTASYPPYDPWFAGGYLNYYYFGQVVMGVLIKLSGVVPTVSYNLAVPLLFALTAGGVFSVAFNLASGAEERPIEAGDRGEVESEHAVNQGPEFLRATIVGLAAAGLVCVAGNLGGALQVIHQLSAIGGEPVRSRLPGVEGLLGVVAGVWRVAAGEASLSIPVDWYWASTRVIEGTINEFPFFTFLYADLHAHLIALPFTVLALGAAVDALRCPLKVAPARVTGDSLGTRWLTGYPRLREGLSRLLSVHPGLPWMATAALAVGALLATNVWDFPTYLLIVGCALALPWYRSPHRNWSGLVRAGAAAITVAVLGYLLFLPFHRYFRSFYSGVDPFPDKSPLPDYLVIHGLFLYVLVSFAAFVVWHEYRATGVVRWLRLAGRRWEQLPRLLALQGHLVHRQSLGETTTVYALVGIAVLAVLLAAAGMAVIGLLLVLLGPTLWLLWHRRRPLEELFALGLFGLGLGLGIVCELFAIQGDIGRMNTVFKFYLQVWVLWSLASAVALGAIWRQGWVDSRSRWGRAWIIGLSVLVLAAMVYPLVATRARVADRFDPAVPLTLDGTAYMHRSAISAQDQTIALLPDLQAIRWLQDNVVGTPTILEAGVGPQPHVPLYSWGSRISSYTGLPTVQGWDWHQKQQRWGYREMIDDRLRDVWTMYADPSPARALDLLRQYGVQYIYVGALERAYYPPSGLDKFDRMVGSDLELVYDRDGVKIYHLLGEGR